MDKDSGIELSDEAEDVLSPGGRRGGGRKYEVVGNHDADRAVIEMSSIDPASSSSLPQKIITVGEQPVMGSVNGDRTLPSHVDVNGLQSQSKLELFGFDSLVNILGLKSMTGDQLQAPSSP
ncbi:hypothetical protein Leryth_000182 [Lithospermum erythrorhizon]|nr:hypothetical protein Leryth_000182 [Lithospermum erythrorhizon]